VLVLVCFPPVVKGPRGSTSPIRYKTTYVCCRVALSLAFLIAGKNAYILHRTALLPLLSRVDTLFSVTMTHALSLVEQPRLPGICKSCPQWLTTMQSPCHGLWWNDPRRQKGGQNKIKKTKNAPCSNPAPDDHFQMQVTTLFRICETSAPVVTHHTRDPDGSGTCYGVRMSPGLV
jgi:hypothetical protein